MIKKVKELMDVKENIDGMTKTIEKNSKAVEESIESFKKEIANLRAETEEIRKENKAYLKELSGNIESFSTIKEQMKKELYDFKLFKKELRNALLEKTDKEISTIKSLMTKEVNEFNELKKTLNTKTSDLKNLDAEITQLRATVKEIGKMDFDLVRHKKNIENADKEKLQLMRQVDSLQRLVSSLRRKSRQ